MLDFTSAGLAPKKAGVDETRDVIVVTPIVDGALPVRWAADGDPIELAVDLPEDAERGVVAPQQDVQAVVNAVWDLRCRREGKPLWKLLADMSPEEIVSAVDFRHITDAITPEEAQEQAAARAETELGWTSRPVREGIAETVRLELAAG